ncbi:unnamed protein product [Callosobruchus maculatus]|uniref:Uncharacterized protein n=3 Tax=Callosobruchus maculatus TaxID=64391 RepID=A0A653CBH8_CALMS|nr:unnamed protein product [Callosobruchus maculatus]
MEVDTSSSDVVSEERNRNLKLGRILCSTSPGEDIVISGLSGSYPMSNDVYEFQDKLFRKVNMITPNRRWAFKHPEIPSGIGTMPQINKYDAGFFEIHERQGHSFDCSGRMFQEKAIEAVMDAGINPTDLEGSRTGVFAGLCFGENEKYWFCNPKETDNYVFTGYERSMVPHRVSQFLKLRGPSITVDTACSSSLYAFENAFRALKSGEIDTAIVGGVNVCTQPFLSLQFARLGVLSKDCSCKSFDQAGNGYVRSECASVVVLQRAKDANRVYANVVYCKTNCDGYKEQGITYPSGQAQAELLKEFYEDCNVNTADLSYLEAHGTGTPVGDPEECNAVDEILTKNRNKPLLIGSVKSNAGHAEPGSGVCSITKCIIGMETGLIPPNLHYFKPRPDIKALSEGRLTVVTSKTPFDEKFGLFGINNFGFGGGNCHILLSTHKKKKINNGLPVDNLPRLVCVSGRTSEAVLTLLDELRDNGLDAEHVALFHRLFRMNVRNHIYRGYAIVSKSGEIYRYHHRSHAKKAIFVAFGELNDWIAVGGKLMEIPVFADSLQRSQKYLLDKRIDITDILKKATNRDSYSVVGNIAVQLGVVDILRQLEVRPDRYYGNSYGELLAAHLNGNLSLKDMFNCAVAINEAFSKVCDFTSNGINGDSNGIHEPTIGLNNGYNDHTECEDRYGYVAEQFKRTFKSNQLTPIKETLLKELRSLLPTTKGQDFTPEYLLSALTNNFHSTNLAAEENSVLFNLGWIYTNKDIEATVIKYGTEDKQNAIYELLKAIGSMYVCGHQPQLQNLYPPVQFPVSRGTRMISPFIRWNHKRDWYAPYYNDTAEVQIESNEGQRNILLQLSDPQWSFIDGHVIDGRNLFPATGYLYLAWETLCSIQALSISQTTVIFYDCRFHRATNMPAKGTVAMSVTVQMGTGQFEVVEGDVPIVIGRIKLLKDYLKKYVEVDFVAPNNYLKTKDIYKELRLRGYNYTKGFRGLQDCDVNASKGHVKWEDNWITFMDNMLQIKILQTDSRLLYVPIYIREMIVPAPDHLAWVNKNFTEIGKPPNLPVYCDKSTDVIRCGGVTIKGLLASSIPRRKDLGVPVLERYEFIPNEASLDLKESIRVNTQIILESTLMYKIKAVEVVDEYTAKEAELVTPIAHTVLEDQPLIAPTMKILSKTPIDDVARGPIPVEDKDINSEKDWLLVVMSKIFSRPPLQDIDTILSCVAEKGFVLSREPKNFDPSTISSSDIVICTIHKTPTECLVFFKKQSKERPMNVVQITNTESFPWMERVQNLIKMKPNEDILLYAEKEPLSGIMGLVNCLRREPESRNVKGLFLMDTDKTFSPSDPFFAKQLKKDMAMNVLKEGKWGTYRHLLLSDIKELENEHFVANVTLRGDLSSLKWLEGPLNHKMKPPSEKSMVYICYATINFRDVMTATGKINADTTPNRLEQEILQGFEYSGIDEHGNRVMGMSTSRALSTMLLNDEYLTMKIPDHMSLEDAATIPVVYTTVAVALKLRAGMKRGDSILIHSGTGGIGQAAIRVALYEGCTVYTTVGTREKRDFLRKEFPQINVNHIGNSRDTSFEQMVYRGTKGRGVDIVLNSLAEEKLLAGVRCLARGGRFVELGKFDLAGNHPLQLELLRKEASFVGVMLDRLLEDTPETKLQMVRYLEQAMRSDAVKPLNRTVFKYNEVEQAFRYMTTGKHMGKVIVQIRDPKEITSIPPVKTFKGHPR